MTFRGASLGEGALHANVTTARANGRIEVPRLLKGILILAVPIDARVSRHQKLVKDATSRPRLLSMVQSGSQAARRHAGHGYFFKISIRKFVSDFAI